MKTIQLLLFNLLIIGAIQLKGDEISSSDYSLVPQPYITSPRTSTEFKNFSAFAVLLDNGQLFSYGRESLAPTANAIVAPQLPDDFTVYQIYSSPVAFMALSTQGKVVSWGDPAQGSVAPTDDIDVQVDSNTIVSNFTGFVARLKNGKLAEWGTLSLSPDVQEAIDSGKKVVQLYAGYTIFVAVLEDSKTHVQTLISWGYNRANPSESLNKTISVPSTTKVQTVVTTFGAATALFSDGSIQSWGAASEGGLTASIPKNEKIMRILAGQHAFAALSNTGHIYGWGNANFGGFSPTLPEKTAATAIYANDVDFAVMLNDGNIFSWGFHIQDPKTQKNQKIIPRYINKNRKPRRWPWSEETTSLFLDEVQFIIPNGEAFAALTIDDYRNNKIFTWGSANEENSPGRTISTKGEVSFAPVPAVSAIIPCQFSFTVLYQDGTIQSWGKWADGKTDIATPSLPQKEDGTVKKVTALVSDLNAYMAILEDGSLFYWGGACSPPLTDGTFQPSADFSYGKTILISGETPAPKALWFVYPFAKYIYNGPLATDSPSESATRAQ
ncbi:MAG: hypothetical protein K2W99_00635 [Chthoniobacterales bacterium]|nr:hypothetical protein [Chthoniobacterales bacterium]